MLPYINVFGVSIASYGLMMVIGCTAGVLLGLHECKRIGCPTDDGIIILCAAGLAAMFFGKLLYLFTSLSPAELIGQIRQGDFSALADGGLVFYGGAIGGFGGAAIGLKITGQKAEPYLRGIVPAIPLGHAIGRVGCFMAGCCYGRPYTGFGAVTYSYPVGGAPVGISLFPVQLAESLINLCICAVLLRLSRKRNGWTVTAAYMMLYGLARFGLEFLRFDSIRGSLWVFSTSQWISLALVWISAVYLVFARYRRLVSEHDEDGERCG